MSRLAARYVLLSVPSLFFSGIAECLKRYLMAQGVVMPTACASFYPFVLIGTLMVHILPCLQLKCHMKRCLLTLKLLYCCGAYT